MCVDQETREFRYRRYQVACWLEDAGLDITSIPNRPDACVVWPRPDGLCSIEVDVMVATDGPGISYERWHFDFVKPPPGYTGKPGSAYSYIHGSYQ